MRQSAAATRASQGALTNSHASVAAAASKLLEKKKEFDAVSALERASALYLERIEGLGEDCDIMADSGQAHGQVLEQWPRMFQILSLFLASRNANDETAGPLDQPDTDLGGQRLTYIRSPPPQRKIGDRNMKIVPLPHPLIPHGSRG
ncbi:putative DASH complex subunit Dad2 [Lyophyllum shimeji]|uniref:DASH complex subunit Dad2 n=1 Tax=Lyophyllum shimeji TaxID=47721 RepID=A0A9P3UNG7_LYOSH|nr:putative DASH complex subunit Dad2 [Lyophyllum shimeji]